jgi:Restriction endonuclease
MDIHCSQEGKALREDDLFDPMIAHLHAQGYQIVEQHRGHERGVDIVATRDGRRLYLQLKGDSAALDVDFGTDLYQVMKLMGEEADFAIGLSEAYLPYVRRCEHALRKLEIGVFVITNTGVKVVL